MRERWMDEPVGATTLDCQWKSIGTKTETKFYKISR